LRVALATWQSLPVARSAFVRIYSRSAANDRAQQRPRALWATISGNRQRRRPSAAAPFGACSRGMGRRPP